MFVQNEDIILHGKQWSEDAKQRVREARKAGRSVYEMFAGYYKQGFIDSRRKRGLIAARKARVLQKVDAYKKTLGVKKSDKLVDLPKRDKSNKQSYNNDKDKSKKTKVGSKSSSTDSSSQLRPVKIVKFNSDEAKRAREDFAKARASAPAKVITKKETPPSVKANIEIRKLEKKLGRNLEEKERNKIRSRYL